jgi:VanZ family protein
MRIERRAWPYWIALGCWMGVIFGFSSLPGSSIPKVFDHQDIAFHAAVYALLGWLFRSALSRTDTALPGRKAFIITLLFSVVYAITDEIHQYFVPLRSATAWDVLVDSFGALIGGFRLHDRDRAL